MEKFLSELKLSIFDLMAYIFPSIILILFLSVLFLPNWSLLFQNYWPYVLIISYIIGNILHQLSFVIKSLLWKLYNNIKERDKKNHSVKKPTTVKGKCALFLRYFLLDRKILGSLNKKTDTLVKSKYKLEDVSSFDIFIFKETFAASVENTPASFDYLHYQAVLSFSFSLVCIFLILIVLFKTIFSNVVMYLNNNNYIDFKYISLVIISLLLVCSYTFFRRGVFFEKYRKSVINSIVLKFFKNDNE
jgi:hypothetical protein